MLATVHIIRPPPYAGVRAALRDVLVEAASHTEMIAALEALMTFGSPALSQFRQAVLLQASRFVDFAPAGVRASGFDSNKNGEAEVVEVVAMVLELGGLSPAVTAAWRAFDRMGGPTDPYGGLVWADVVRDAADRQATEAGPDLVAEVRKLGLTSADADDTNRDGRISEEEILAWMAQRADGRPLGNAILGRYLTLLRSSGLQYTVSWRELAQWTFSDVASLLGESRGEFGITAATELVERLTSAMQLVQALVELSYPPTEPCVPSADTDDSGSIGTGWVVRGPTTAVCARAAALAIARAVRAVVAQHATWKAEAVQAIGDIRLLALSMLAWLDQQASEGGLTMPPTVHIIVD